MIKKKDMCDIHLNHLYLVTEYGQPIDSIEMVLWVREWGREWESEGDSM